MFRFFIILTTLFFSNPISLAEESVALDQSEQEKEEQKILSDLTENDQFAQMLQQWQKQSSQTSAALLEAAAPTSYPEDQTASDFLTSLEYSKPSKEEKIIAIQNRLRAYIDEKESLKQQAQKQIDEYEDGIKGIKKDIILTQQKIIAKHKEILEKIEEIKNKNQKHRQSISDCQARMKTEMDEYQQKIEQSKDTSKKASLTKEMDQRKLGWLQEFDRINKIIETNENWIKGLREKISSGNYDGMGMELARNQDMLSQWQTLTGKMQQRYDSGQFYGINTLDRQIEQLETTLSKLGVKTKPQSQNNENENENSNATNGLDEILELWKQKGYVEEVTEQEYQQAQQAYREYIEKTTDNLIAENFEDKVAATEKLKKELTKKAAGADVPEEKIENAVNLEQLGIEIDIDDLLNEENIQAFDSGLAEALDDLEELGEICQQADAIFMDSLDTILDDLEDGSQSGKYSNLADAIKQQLENTTTTSNVAQQVEDALSGKSDNSTTDNKAAKALDNLQTGLNLAVGQSQDTTNQAGSTDTAKQLEEQSLLGQVWDWAWGKTKDKAQEQAQKKGIEYAKEKVIETYGDEIGNKYIEKYDKTIENINKVQGIIDKVKEVKQTIDTANEIQKKGSDAGAVFYVGAKAVGATVAKYATGPIGTMATQTIEMGTQVMQAAVDKGEQIATRTGAVNWRYTSQVPNQFLNKIGKTMDDEDGMSFSFETDDGQEKTVKVYQWVKVKKAGKEFWAPQNEDGRFVSGVYAEIEQRPCYKFWGTDKITIYDRDSLKPLKKYEMKL